MYSGQPNVPPSPATLTPISTGTKPESFLSIAIDFNYFFCLGPFRVVKHRDFHSSTRVVAQRSWPQTILCVGVTFLGFFWIISDFRTALPSDLNNPSLYFRMLLKVDVSLSKFMFFKMLWCDQQEIVDMFTFIFNRDKNILPGFMGNISRFVSRKFVAVFIGLLYMGNAMIEVITGHYTGSSLGGVRHSQWNIAWWWDSMIDAGEYNFFLDDIMPSPARNVSSMGLFEWGPIDHFVGVLSTIGFLQR